jgi:hypothetical protein
MGTFTTFDAKITTEDLFLDFNFISDLEVGETISGAEVTCSVFSGIDATPSAVISGTATVSGGTVTQKVIDGTAGVIYLLTCSITTTSSAIKFMQGYLAVISTNPFEA